MRPAPGDVRVHARRARSRPAVGRAVLRLAPGGRDRRSRDVVRHGVRHLRRDPCAACGPTLHAHDRRAARVHSAVAGARHLLGDQRQEGPRRQWSTSSLRSASRSRRSGRPVAGARVRRAPRGGCPTGGYVPFTEDPIDSIRSIVPPVLALSLGVTSVFTRYVRTAMIDVMNEDFIRSAMAQGRTRAWCRARPRRAQRIDPARHRGRAAVRFLDRRRGRLRERLRAPGHRSADRHRHARARGRRGAVAGTGDHVDHPDPQLLRRHRLLASSTRESATKRPPMVESPPHRRSTPAPTAGPVRPTSVRVWQRCRVGRSRSTSVGRSVSLFVLVALVSFVWTPYPPNRSEHDESSGDPGHPRIPVGHRSSWTRRGHRADARAPATRCT